MKQGIKKLVAAGCLTAVFVSGCHKPTFEGMEPSSIKWSMTVVSSVQSAEDKQRVEAMTQDTAVQRGLAADVVYPVKEGDLAKFTGRTGLDLVLASADTPQIGELAKLHPELRFSLLGDTSEPALSNVRHLVHDRKKLLFLAGFLAAEANRTSIQPFTVIVSEVRAAEDPDWQMIMAGLHYAGRTDVPLQVPMGSFDRAEAEGESAAAGTSTKPVLKGLSLLLLDPLSAKAWEQLGSNTQLIVRTDEKSAAVPLQDRVIAQPASLYEAAMRQEADLLVSGKWTGQQKVTVAGKRTYAINSPASFGNQQMDVRLELIEEQLRSGSLKPEDYLYGTAAANDRF